MNAFLIPLSHPCLFVRGKIRVLEGVVELRSFCLGLQEIRPVLLYGTSLWLMRVVAGDAFLRSWAT